jgi:hypothetical protein
MSSDAGERLPEAPRSNFTLPRVLDIQIRATKFEPPRHRNFASALPAGDDAVEFIVKTDGSIPVRALGPALHVGNTVVTEATEIGPNTYRFVATTRAGLVRGAPIRLTWTGQPLGGAQDTGFRYQL